MRLGFSPLTARMLDLDAAFALAQELEMEFVELSADLYEIVPAMQGPEQVRELKRATGLDVTVHLSYIDLNLASLVPMARRASLERTQRGLEFAHDVSALCGVLHSGLHYLRHPQADALAAAALEESMGELEGSSVPITLENLALTPNDYLRGPEELDALTRRHGMRNCVDFGHAHVESHVDERASIQAYLDTLGTNVVHLHLHNNHGQLDEHLATDAGSIDYAPFREYLATFAGTVCLEIGTEEAGVRASVAHMRSITGSAA